MGYIRTPEIKAKSRRSMKKKLKDPDYVKKISKTWFKEGHIPWSKGKKVGTTISEEGRKRISESTKKMMKEGKLIPFKKGESPWYYDKENYTPDKHPAFRSGKQAMYQIIKKKYPYCQKCGIKDKRVLQIHHIDGSYEGKWRTNKNHKLENLIVLCANCHIIIHRK